ncbi:MAG: GAF domain-containing protein [Armatimonadota bacterium]
MIDSKQQSRTQLRTRLIALLDTDRASIVHAWSRLAMMHAALPDSFNEQAERLLSTLAAGLAHPPVDERRVTLAQDAALQQEFPAVYHASTLLSLAMHLVERCDGADHTALPAVFEIIQEGLTAPPATAFTERLARLSQLSVELGRLHGQDAITELALTEAPRLVGAESAALWLWDADLEAPAMLQTLPKSDAPPELPELPDHLLHLFRQASTCAFPMDPGEDEEGSWPEPLTGRTVAFVPLPDEHGCRGILTVQGRAGHPFSWDDIFLLWSFGNLISFALQNAQLHEKEHRLVTLLQSSIGKLVQATYSPLGQHEVFIQSLLQVAGGLTRASAVGACVTVDPEASAVVTATGMSVPLESMLQLTRGAYAAPERLLLPDGPAVNLAEADGLDPALRRLHYTSAPIRLGDRPAGGILALSAVPLSEEQTAFLHTIAGLIGVGIANMEQARSNSVLLAQMSDLLAYITNVITRQLSEHEDDAQQIMQTTAQIIAHAAGMPISICGWATEDGIIRVWPGTTVGIPAELEAKLADKATDHHVQLPLTVNNRVIRAALTQQQPQSKQQEGAHARPAFRWLSELGVQEWICVPMVVQKEARGIVLLAHTERHPLTTRQVALLSTYANQAALALENSLLNEGRRRSLARMEKLYDYTSSISANLVINDILQKVMQSASDILRVQAALVSLSVEDSILQRASLTQGFSRPIAANILFPDDGIIGTVAKRRRAVDSIDLPGDGRDMVLRVLAADEGLTSSLTAPVMAHMHGALLGTLTVFSREAREFTTEEVDLLRTIASQAAVAIQNAQVLVQERQRARDLQTLVRQFSRQVPPRLLELTLEVLEVSRQEDAPAEALARTRRRLECLHTVQQELSDEHVGMLNVKVAMERLMSARMLQAAEDRPAPRLRVLGAAVILPWRQAALLGLMVHEWLLAAEDGAPAEGLQLDVMFQQAGDDITLQLNHNALHPGVPSPGILALVQQALCGSPHEMTQDGIHRIRYCFNGTED